MANLTKDEMVSYGLITNVDMASSEVSSDDMIVKTKVSDIEAYEVIYEEVDSEEPTTDLTDQPTDQPTTDPVEPNDED